MSLNIISTFSKGTSDYGVRTLLSTRNFSTGAMGYGKRCSIQPQPRVFWSLTWFIATPVLAVMLVILGKLPATFMLESVSIRVFRVWLESILTDHHLAPYVSVACHVLLLLWIAFKFLRGVIQTLNYWSRSLSELLINGQF